VLLLPPPLLHAMLMVIGQHSTRLLPRGSRTCCLSGQAFFFPGQHRSAFMGRSEERFTRVVKLSAPSSTLPYGIQCPARMAYSY
jgi:hypothetical protein